MDSTGSASAHEDPPEVATERAAALRRLDEVERRLLAGKTRDINCGTAIALVQVEWLRATLRGLVR